MKNARFSTGLKKRRNRPAIKTTFMELIREITKLTKDDALVQEIVKRIFASHRVRSTRTRAPVRLINNSDHARPRAWA
jgi:hypothetical protein